MRVLPRLCLAAVAVLAVGCTAPSGTTPAPDSPAAGTPSAAAPTASPTAAGTVASVAPGQEVDAHALLAAVAKAQRDAKTSTASFEVTKADKSVVASGTAALDFGGETTRMYAKGTQQGGVEVMIDGATAYVKAGELTQGKWLKGSLSSVPEAVRDVQQSYDAAALQGGVDKAVLRGEETVEGVRARHYTLTGSGRTQELWVGPDYRPVRSQWPESEGTFTTTFSGYGRPVTIPTPPASEVVQLPG